MQQTSNRKKSANCSSTIVKDELEKLLCEGHIEKLTNYSDQDPKVNTAKKIKQLNLLWTRKKVNRSIPENEYRMPEIDSLIQGNL